MASKRDYYEILGVSRSSDAGEMKKVYRRLAMEYHPDRNPDNTEAEERFREIQEAYEVLSDPEKRALYDQFGHDGVRSSGYQGPSMDMEDIFGGFQSIFEDFFGGGGGRRSRRRGQDLRYRLGLGFREAALGCKKTIELLRKEVCKRCEGSRAEPGSSPSICPHCQGTGTLRVTQGFFSMAQTCPHCSGSGQMIKNPCRQCQGTGLEEHPTSIEVEVPAGVDSGIRLRVSGEGEPASNGMRGDLFVEIEVEQDEVFERDGSDLYTRVYISYPKAVLGGEVEVPLLEGTKTIQLPEQIGLPYIHRMNHEGVVDLRSKTRGQLFVEFQVATPKKPSPRAKEILEELDQELELDIPQESPQQEQKKKGFFDHLFN